MSERASLLSSSLGLLEERCPSSRKKDRYSRLAIIGCMHLKPLYQDFQFMWPVPFVTNFYDFKEGTSFEDNLLPFR
ncbi:hypothetical protein MIMGU_mgv1a017437mg [Erythranthe guttata]|uniref:Uncharacterized protein n=1 Tax=Erythranthe guttata TaxID=4155 RepID=A0A022Q4I1_ERYGU|nr:hypothetical protein MIMGU_mgv1a017437mg [Erythranthe guttata]